MSLVVTNQRSGQALASNARRADSFWTRFKGLMGVRELPAGSGLLIEPCNSIHCFGMRLVIDAVFISREGEVLHLMPDMAPGKVSPLVRRSRMVLELPAGTIAATDTRVGDKLSISG